MTISRDEVLKRIMAGELCRHPYLVVREDGPPTCKICGRVVPEVNLEKHQHHSPGDVVRNQRAFKGRRS